MEISLRLKCIAGMLKNCDAIADIGSDHAYLPIYCVKMGICSEAIVSDINKGPVEKAKLNVSMEALKDKIECRLGAGLNTIKPYEVNAAVIAGMGGNLIRDIIEERLDIFKSLEYCILQPVQNPDILRKHLIEKGYNIIDEELCIDEGKYYEIIKVKYDDKSGFLDDIYYEVSKKLIEKKHPLLNEFVKSKILRYNKIINSITENSETGEIRKKTLRKKVDKLEELLKCL